MKCEVYAYRCRKCGTLHYPFRMVCKKCCSNEPYEFDPAPIALTGKLLTFTRLNTLPGDFDVPDILFGIVELENGLRVTAQLDMDSPSIGMRVSGSVDVVRKSGFRKFHGMVFRPAS